MNSDFQAHGRALLGNGYLIIPIKPGYKRPAIGNWQTARLGAADLTRYPAHGVGVLCGQGPNPVAAFDVDTTDAALATRFVAWCRERLGTTCERVGFAPKILLAYRAEAEGWRKAASAWFEDAGGGRHRLEVLGKGQQFVAYHTHPDTRRPYEWVDLFGGLDAVRARDLPVVTAAQVEDAVQAFEAMAGEAGLVRAPGGGSTAGGGGSSWVSVASDDDPLMTFEPPVGIDIAEAGRLVAYIEDNEDYDTWLRVGMSLHHEFGGSAEALALWDRWSRTARNYAGRDDLEKRWRAFGKPDRNPATARWLLKAGRQGQRDALKAGKRAALDDARGLILSCNDSIDLVNDIARRAGGAAGADLALRAELAGLIRTRFREVTGTNLSAAEVRAAMDGGRTAVASGRQRRQMTEFGNAERMLDSYGDGLMYVPEISGWFIWTGVYWRRASDVELEHLAKETVRALPDEAKTIESDGERAEFFRFCAASQRAVMVRNMVSLAQSDPRVVVSVADLDRHSHLLGVGNGAVDLRTGELLPPNQAHRITTIAAADFNPAATCPLFEQTVSDAFFGDADMISFLQRLVGYSLLGQPDEDAIVIPYGGGSNGKSTVFETIRKTLGGYARMASSDTFLSSGSHGGSGGANAGAAREDVLRLRGARFVYIDEPEQGSELREGFIKAMTGGEPMPARGLYSKTTVEVMPTWVAFMPTNHLPIVKGDDHAIWRRLLLVPFTRNFDHDTEIVKDLKRKEKLIAEAEGVLAWCVRGALAYQKEGLRLPVNVRRARESYKGDMDLLSEWIDECCETGQDYTETNARVWASWEAFARARGELRFIPTAKSLGRRLASRGFSAIRNPNGVSGRGWLGLRVRQPLDYT